MKINEMVKELAVKHSIILLKIWNYGEYELKSFKIEDPKPYYYGSDDEYFSDKAIVKADPSKIIMLSDEYGIPEDFISIKQFRDYVKSAPKNFKFSKYVCAEYFEYDGELPF